GDKARNPYYEDFGANNCTNFVSQILWAGGQKYMLYHVHGDGSWWYRRLSKWEDTFNTAFAAAESTESWRLADILPRHLWQYGLVHIDVQEPYAWTKGDILAEDWVKVAKGTFDQLHSVLVSDSPAGNPQELLIPNDPPEANKFSSLPW